MFDILVFANQVRLPQLILLCLNEMEMVNLILVDPPTQHNVGFKTMYLLILLNLCSASKCY